MARPPLQPNPNLADGPPTQGEPNQHNRLRKNNVRRITLDQESTTAAKRCFTVDDRTPEPKTVRWRMQPWASAEIVDSVFLSMARQQDPIQTLYKFHREARYMEQFYSGINGLPAEQAALLRTAAENLSRAKHSLDDAYQIDYNLIDENDHQDALEYKLNHLTWARWFFKLAITDLRDFLTASDLGPYGIQGSKVVSDIDLLAQGRLCFNVWMEAFTRGLFL